MVLWVVLFSALLSGSVVDADGGFYIGGSRVLIVELGKVVWTAPDGTFACELTPGTYTLVVSSVGYKTDTLKVEVGDEDCEITVKLTPMPFCHPLVTVTATKLPTPVLSLPFHASSVGRLDSKVSSAVEDALSLVEGVYIKKAKPSDLTLSVSVRGMGRQRTLVMLNDVPLNDAYSGNVFWSIMPEGMIHRVEILQGPASALYGGYGMGGCVNVLAGIDQFAKVKTGGGSYGLIEGNGTYGTKMGDLNVSVSILSRTLKGYRNNLIVKTPRSGTGDIYVEGWEKTQTTTGSTAYLIGDRGDNYFTDERVALMLGMDTPVNWELFYVRGDRGYGYNEPKSYIYDSTGTPVYEGRIWFVDEGDTVYISLYPYTFLGSYGNKIAHLVGGKLNFGAFVVKGSALFQDEWYVSPISGADFGRGRGKLNTTSANAFTAGASYILPVLGTRLLMGLDVRQDEALSKTDSLSNWRDTESITNVDLEVGGSFRLVSLYLQDEFAWRNLGIWAGIRGDYWIARGGYTGEDSFPSHMEYAISPRVGLRYKVWEYLVLRASGGMGFRPPTVYEMYKTWTYYGNVYLANPELSPEKSMSFDAGFDVVYSPLVFRATGYHCELEDLIYSKTVGEDSVMKDNVGGAEINGIEGMVEFRLGSLSAFGTFTLQSARVTENEEDTTIVGNFLQDVPWAMYTGGARFSVDRFEVVLDADYISKRYRKDTNADTISYVYGSYDPRLLVNAKLSFKPSKHFTVSFAVNNILDEHYYTYYLSPGRNYRFWIECKM